MNKFFLLIIFLVLIINLLCIYFLVYNETIYLFVKQNNLNKNTKTQNKYLPPRNLLPIKNKYEIIKDTYDFSDFHIIIYYNDDFNCKIIVRRLDDDKIISPIIISIYSSDLKDNQFITLKKTNTNEIIFDHKTLFKLETIDTTQEQIIPKTIIQTTRSNVMSRACYTATQTFIDLNPEYEYKLYDDNDCIEFIKNNFDQKVLNAYNKIIPGAYKADLFRYCVLFINGGCYFDIKQILRVPLRELIAKNEEIILTEDNLETCYYNAVMIVEKNHPLMIKLINQIVENVINNYYGTCPLCPTGPCLLYNLGKHIKPKFFYKPTYSEILFHQLRSKASITYKGKKIINITYYGYYKSNDKTHYSYLWITKNVYK